MSTDYRALCAELLNALENAIGVIYGEDGTKHISTADAVITKADAALAQPESEGVTLNCDEIDVPWTYLGDDVLVYRAGYAGGWAKAALGRHPEPQEATDEEISDLWSWAAEQDQGPWPTQQHCFARAVIAADRARTALAQPEPEGVSYRDVLALRDELDADGYGTVDLVAFAHAILARWGRPAIQPVPVSERLPGPEDCDARGWCWYWHPGEECWEMVPVVTGTLDEWTHWLPHHVLPIPTP
jgi:hypothetical protein